MSITYEQYVFELKLNFKNCSTSATIVLD